MPNTGRYCCVTGCKNNENFCIDGGIRFHRFPGRSSDIERKLNWIRAINRRNKDGTLWLPTTGSRICSAHFVGGRKSDAETDPAYLPTIFPLSSTAEETIKFAELSDIKNDHSYTHSKAPRKRIKSKKDTEKASKRSRVTDKTAASLRNKQVCLLGMDGKLLRLSSTPGGNTATTQCEINQKSAQNSQFTENTAICKRIHGIEDLQNEKDLHYFTGASPATFKLLLKILQETNQQISLFLSQETVLLLFLMKMKFGMPFNVLGTFFNVHRTTTSRIFAHVLEILTIKTEKYLFWPRRNTTVPDEEGCQVEIFDQHYPNTNVIIDMIEIKTDQLLEKQHSKATDATPKHYYSFKALLAFRPQGSVCFKSKCYPATVSDREIIINSGILDLLEPNDVVIINRNIHDIKEHLNDGITIIEPPIIDDVIQHIDKFVPKIQMSNILKTLPTNLFRYVDNIVQMACILANFLLPTVQETDNK